MVSEYGFKSRRPSDSNNTIKNKNSRKATERVGKIMRKAMITRTVESTVFDVFCVDASTQTTETKTFKLAGRVKDADKALRKLRAEHETENVKLVYIVDSRLEQRLYGMTEEDFVANAVELDENRKPIAQ